ncbi:hypothetical protein Bca4012_051006 [Brassica carinata]
MARYRHLVFHILEFLQKHQLYPDEQILKFKIELLNKTNKSLHHTEDAPQDIIMSVKVCLFRLCWLVGAKRLVQTRLNVGITQHKLVPEETVTVIDSRCGEKISVYKGSGNDSITQQFDACASWWTQGPDPAFQAELAREMAYTAARFGHVMFPENVYEPALKCAELLIDGVGKGWASRVYFSYNGSTAIEIALKMAFPLRGSYHGDTLGAMEAQAPLPYTGFLQQPCVIPNLEQFGHGCTDFIQS